MSTEVAPDVRLAFFARFLLALLVPFRLLFDPVFAARVQALAHGRALPAPAPQAALPEPARAPAPAPPPKAADGNASALHLLAILQRDGRFVDFLQEDVAGFSDAEVGAAARIVHDGCSKAVRQYVVLAPVRMEREGGAVRLEPGFNAAEVRLTGNVSGQPPFSGRLQHAGWRATKVELPPVPAGQDPSIIAPAEVEL